LEASGVVRLWVTGQNVLSPVEKVIRPKIVEKTLQYEAPQSTISVLVAIFYLKISAGLRKSNFFITHAWLQQHRRLR
jgi:hypothetical protein